MSGFSPARRFLLFTFVFSWSLWCLGSWLRAGALRVKLPGVSFELPFYDAFLWIGAFGPGFVTLFMVGEKEDPSSLWARLTNWRVDQMWYSIATFLPVGLVTFATIAYAASGGSVYWGAPTGYWSLFFIYLLLGSFWEELGWRGFLLPMLLRTRDPLRASLYLGVVWGLWHLPLRWGEWSGQPDAFFNFFLIFCIMTTGLAVIFTWMFLQTRGALFPVILLHAVFNVAVNLFVNPTATWQGMGLVLWLAATVWLAALLIYRLGGLRKSANSTGPLATSH